MHLGLAEIVGGKHRSETAVLAIAAGGSFNCLAETPDIIHADRLLAVDVLAELCSLHFNRAAVLLPVVPGETVATLMAKAAMHNPVLGPAHERLRSFPATTLDEGLGMLRSVGVAATTVALANPAIVQRLRAEVLMPLRRQRNGWLQSLDLRYYNSLAGGTGGPVGRAFAEELAEYVRQSTAATVTVTGLQLGAITFLGLGDETRVAQNSAVSLLEQVAYTLDPQRPAREARALTLFELPTIDALGNELGADRQTRAQLAAALSRALASSGLQEETLRGRSNIHLANRFGSITQVRSAWYGIVGSAPIIAAAARYYATAIEQLPRQAPPPESLRPTLHVELEPLPADSQPKVADDFLVMMNHQRGRKAKTLEQQLCADAARRAILRVQIGMEQQPLAQWVHTVATVTTTAQLVAGYAHLRDVEHAVRTLQTSVEQRKSLLQHQVDGRREALLALANRLFHPQHYHVILDEFLGVEGKQERFRQAYNDFHQVQRDFLDAEATSTALTAGIEHVQRALALLDELTQRTARILTSFIQGQTELVCEFRPLAEIFPELVRIINARDQRQLRSFLAACACVLPLTGLATLLETEATLDAVVQRLLSPPRYDGPAWGGDGSGRAPSLRAWVFPPLTEGLRQQLEEAIAQHDLPRSVFTTDSLASGGAVMLMEFSDVGSLSDVFPPAYRLGLSEALTTDSDLFPITDRARDLATEILRPDAVPTNSASPANHADA